MKSSNVSSFFAPATVLAQSALSILVVKLILALVDVIPTPMNIPGVSLLLLLVHVILFFMAVGLTLATPVLLQYVEKHKKISISHVFSVMNTYARKSGPAVFGVYAIATLLITIFFFFVSMMVSPSLKGQMNMAFFAKTWWGVVMFRLLFDGGLALLSTAPIFYSLKEKGLLSSLSHSFRYGIAHIDFTLVLFLVWFLSALVVEFIIRLAPSITLPLRAIEGTILGYYTSCVAYLYYKKNAK